MERAKNKFVSGTSPGTFPRFFFVSKVWPIFRCSSQLFWKSINADSFLTACLVEVYQSGLDRQQFTEKKWEERKEAGKKRGKGQRENFPLGQRFSPMK